MATGTADCIRRRLDVVADREPVEERGGEVADTGALVQQRVRVDGDAEAGVGTKCHGRRG